MRNHLFSERINILVGAHNLTDPAIVQQIVQAGRYILLQSEIITGNSINNWNVQRSFADIYIPLMRQAQSVWTGVESNLSQLKELGIKAELISPGYHPAMEEVVHKQNKDIDFLFFGSLTDHRRRMLEELRARGGNVVNVFDNAAVFRNDLIARTRVNLAPNQGPSMSHLGWSRVLYLVNNRSIVVVERCHDQEMYEHCFPFADTEQWADLCMETLRRPDLDRITREHYEQFKKIRMVDQVQPLIDKLRTEQGASLSTGTFIKSNRQKHEDRFAPDQSVLLFHVKQKHIVAGMTSIIIQVHNQLEYAKNCINSIRRYTPDVHEIIFVDNGSTDATVKWLERLERENPNYHLIKNEHDFGFARSYNQGIEISQGEFLLLLDNDVVVTEGWLSAMLACLNSASDTGIIGPMTNAATGPQQVPGDTYASVDYLDTYAQEFRETYRHRRIPLRKIDRFCMLFKRELVERIGLLDEDLGSGIFTAEDFCLRAALDQYRNLIAGEVFIHHHGGRGPIRNTVAPSLATIRSKQVFDEKWGGIVAKSRIGKRVLTLNALERADECKQKDQIDKAVESSLEAIRQSPDDRKVYHALAELLIDFKQYQDASDALNESPPDEQDLRGLELMGYCKEGLELYAEAQALADRVLELHPTSGPALNLKGMLTYKQEDRAAAEAYFKEAVLADPGYGEPQTNLGVLSWAAEQQEEGISLLERGFILSPTVSDVVTTYHAAVTALGAFERAERVFRDASALHPADKRLKFLLIDVLIQQNKHLAAVQLIEEAMVAFGTDDGIVSAALAIRDKIGPKTIQKTSKSKGTLSLCMIVKNEEEHLARCLFSVEPMVDEIIVVDTGSTDRTVDIARAFGAQVYDFAWTNNFAEARNFSLSKAAGNWILVLDADEVISRIDHGALIDIVKRKTHKLRAYSLVTRNYVMDIGTKGWVANDGRYAEDETGTGWHPSIKVRLFTNHMGIKFVGHVHELLEHSLTSLDIRIKECTVPIHHYGQLNTQKNIDKGKEYLLLGKVKLEEEGNQLQSLIELARQAGGLGEHEYALELWREVIDRSPNSAEAFLNIGHANMELGRYHEGLAASAKAMKLDPNLKEAVLNYGMCELTAGEAKQTMLAFEELLKRIPDYPPAMGGLAAAYFLEGKIDSGLEYLDKLKRMGFDGSLTLCAHARRLISVGRNEHAISLLEAALELEGTNQEVGALLFECYKTRDNAALSQEHQE